MLPFRAKKPPASSKTTTLRGFIKEGSLTHYFTVRFLSTVGLNHQRITGPFSFLFEFAALHFSIC